MGLHLRVKLELVCFDTLFLKSGRPLETMLSNTKNPGDSNIPTQLHNVVHALPSREAELLLHKEQLIKGQCHIHTGSSSRYCCLQTSFNERGTVVTIRR